MFSIIKLEDTVSLNPKQFGDILSSVKQNLVSNYENKIIGKVDGFIVKVIDIDESSISSGKVNENTSTVNYLVRYTAILFNPVKNGVLDIIIARCNDISIFGRVKLLETSKNVNIQCIVPRELLIMDGYTYDNGEWVCGDQVIEMGSTLKMKINEFTIDYDKIVIIGSIEK